jgi:hypothetical protein
MKSMSEARGEIKRQALFDEFAEGSALFYMISLIRMP